MVKKKRGKKLKKINGFSIQFLRYSDIKDLDTDKRMRKILGIILQNNILLLQGKLKPEEETRLIGDSMNLIGHVNNFRGIELAVIGNGDNLGILSKMKLGLIKALSGGEINAITIVGPASIVKEIKKNPKKIELFLNK
jgi:hypothetical protein